ncbi:MAG: type II secretion system protein GspD [Beggiatoa sp. IS2]|nr:MAG: type II secretion system protein GspD [Beggiatoa sp. IS2]
MDWFHFRRIILIIGCSGLLISCVTPPKREPPVKATELAESALPTESWGTVPRGTQEPIIELPRSQPQSLQEINQTGSMPPVATLSDKSIPTKLGDDEPLQLDFEQVDLRQIIEIVSDALGIMVVIDPTIGEKINIRTSPDKPLKKKDLWPLLQLLLNDAGVIMEKKGNVYHLKKVGPSLPGTLGSSAESLTGSDAPEVLQVTPLRYIAAASALNILAPLLQPQGRIVTLPNLNIIGIITTPQKLERVNSLLTVIDANPFVHRGIRLFRLKNSKAKDVQAELDKILQAIGGNPPAYQTVALDRANAILVVTPPGSGFDEVTPWIDVLDQSSEESSEQVFIYRVRNLEAKDLASTLTEVFKVEDKKDKDLPKKVDEKQRKSDLLIDYQPKPNQPEPVKPNLSGANAPISAEIKVSIVADESTNNLLIRAAPRDYRQLLKTIALLDQVPKEVMVNMVIAEVTLNETHKFGFDWQAFFHNVSAITNFGIPFPDEAGKASGIVIRRESDSTRNNLNAVLNLVASEGDVRVLSRPSILVRNNEEAEINVGSEEPIVTGGINAGINDGNQTVGGISQSYSVQYRKTGINLKVTPRINEDGIINMKIDQEVSQLGPPRGSNSSFTSRKVSTSVVVSDGNAIVIGGLIETTNTRGEQGIPFLRDIPYVGKALFATKNTEDKRVELVLFIVPEIVNPQASNLQLVQTFRKRMQAMSELLDAPDLFLKGFEHTAPPKPPEYR